MVGQNNIEIKCVKKQERAIFYSLPSIPIDAGEIPSEKGFDLENAVQKFPKSKQEEVRGIGKRYYGRQLDAISILLYAEEQGKFDNYLKKLESKIVDFESIHPELMMARTDVTVFFTRLYADLGIATIEEAERAERQLRNYGVGVVILPKV